MRTTTIRFAAGLFAAGASLYAFEPQISLDGQFEVISQAKAQRTPTEQKIQSCLLYLAREDSGQLAVAGAPALRSRVRCHQDGRVMVDIAAAPTEELKKSLLATGATIISESTRYSAIRALVHSDSLLGLAEREDVKKISLGLEHETHTGSVTSQGDRAHRADATRSDFSVDGTGIRVGVISDSADFSPASITSGDLPAGFTVLPGRFGNGIGEGTAMSEIVHDLAPGAEIYFASAVGGKAVFADSIIALKDAGCRIIVDDISYPNEWQFQDDEIGQAVNTVVENDGVLYISSSGNEGSLKRGNSTTWEGDFVDGGTDSLLPGGNVHSFGTQTYNSMVSDESRVVLQWSDEYNTSGNDYDVYVLSADGTSVVSSGNDTQDGDDEPIEFANANPGERIVIWKATGAAERYVRISCTGGPLAIQTAGQTIGHAATPNCVCVASSDSNAAFPGAFNAGSANEDSSSDGPHRMFYNPDGSAITPGNFLASAGGGRLTLSPAITGADGGSTTLASDSGLNPFFGTSAAAPHCAAIAALILSAESSLTNAELRAILESNCIDIEEPGHDVNSGNGILMPHQPFWRKNHFGTFLAEGNAALFADPDGDGLDNLLEYVTGTDPNVTTPSPIANLRNSATEFWFDYRFDPEATNVSLIFESSLTLETGSFQKVDPTADSMQSADTGFETWEATFGTTGLSKYFLRARAVIP